MSGLNAIMDNSLSALLAAQAGLATSGHNIANANTPGFNRQDVIFGTRRPEVLGYGSIGRGVEVLGIRRSRMAWVTLTGGAIGLALGLWLQYWTAGVDWPLNVGGKPLDSLPAFVPVAFELTILVAGLATAAALFMRSRVWPGRRAPRGLEATTDDAHALILAQRDASFREEEFAELLERHGARECRHQQEVDL